MTRPVPPISERTAGYWRSGADGKLRIATCHACGWRIHPPRPVCPKCQGRGIGFEPVSGRATVWSFSINRYLWKPSMPPPYVVAEVELEEQPGLKVTTNIVGCAPEEVSIGMPVKVEFEQVDDVYIPLFRPVSRL